MFCKKCGKRISEGMLVCENCGTEVSVEETEDAEKQSQKSAVTENAEQKQSSNNEQKSDLTHKEPKKKNDKNRSEITRKKKRIKLRTIIISAISLVLCTVLIVLTFPYIKNTFVKLFMSSEDYFAYVVKNNSEDSAKTIANALDSMKKAKTSQASGHIDVQLEKTFHEILASTTSDVKIGGDAGAFLGQYVDLSVGGMTNWIGDVSADYEITLDDEKSRALLALDINDTEFGKLDMVSDNKNNIDYVGMPGYNEVYISAAGEKTENKKSESSDGIIDFIPGKELNEKLTMKYIVCAAENVGEVREYTKTIDAGKLSKKATALLTEIDKEELAEITEIFVEEIKNDKDIREAIKKEAKAAGVSEDDVIKNIEKVAREINSVYSEKLKTGLELSIYVDAKGEIAGYDFSCNKFEFSNYTLTKWFDVGNTINGKIGVIGFELVGNGKLENDKVKLNYALTVAGSHMADISIYDLNYKKMKDGLYDAKAQIVFTENMSKIGNMLFADDAKDGLPALLLNEASDLKIDVTLGQKSVDEMSLSVLIKQKNSFESSDSGKNQNGMPSELKDIIPDLNMELNYVQKNTDEMSLSVSFTHKNKPVISVDIDNKNVKKKVVTVPENHMDAETDEFLKTWFKTLDDEKFFDFLEKAGANRVSLLRMGYNIYISDNPLAQFGLDLVL